MRDFNKWLSTFRNSIADYHYYTDFNNVYKNADIYKVELHILNSLIGSTNIEEEFKNILKNYPTCLKAIPILLAKREEEIFCMDESSFIYALSHCCMFDIKVCDYATKLCKSYNSYNE